MKNFSVGDPALRPDEDRLHIPTSFELERELRDWEGCALVTWAMRVPPPNTTSRHLEEALVADFRLRPGDVDVTRHRPEAFLIRFQNRRSCEEVNAKGKFKCRGADVCVRPWRSLTGALGAALFYRVRLVLDGVPRHAWQPELVERIVGRTCSLQCVDTNLLHPTDTRGIELWAWTADPSKIPKVMWLIFTTGALDASSSSVQVSETPPRRWQRGIKHRVIIHIWEIHDFSKVSADRDDPDLAVGEPERRQLPWFWGVRDGDQVPTAAFEPFHHPPPPRVQERRNEREEEDRRDRARRDRVDDHPAFRGAHNSNNFDDDDDDERDSWPRDRHGHARRTDTSFGRRHDGSRRERSRSPHRQNRGSDTYGGRRRHSHNDDDKPMSADELEAQRQRHLKLLFSLQVATMEEAASKLLNLQSTPRPALPPPSPRPLHQLFSSAARMAADPGEEAWSVVASDKICSKRVKEQLPPPLLSLLYKRWTPPSLSCKGWLMPVASSTPLQVLQEEHQVQEGSGGRLTGGRPTVCAALSATPLLDGTKADSQAACTDGQQANLTAQLPTLPDAGNIGPTGGGDTLAPQPSVAPGKRGRRLKKPPVEVAALRRSKRQACSKIKHLSAEEKANHVLCRRLGYIKNDTTPAEEAIREFIATFQGPMPDYIIKALSALFHLDDDNIDNATNALIKLGGAEAIEGSSHAA
uniref:DUF4283 domain-containing protein n=1 Tax=Setaria viridis TaxID=4556 RepID=A0A4U6UPM4_SETVI|nr:hypothetical protein SEVIR_5G351000v2 [Setaria viridis]